MDDRKRNIAVGFTAVLGLAGLLVLLLLFGYIPQFLERGYYVNVKLPDAGGLHADSRVTLRGIDIGRVEKIELQPPPSTDVRVIVKVLRDDVFLPQGTRAELASALIGGSTTIAFTTDDVDWENPKYLPRDGTAEIEGDAPLSVGRIAREMKAALTVPMEQFGEVAQRVKELAITWTDVGENLKQLSASRSVDEVDAGTVEPNLTSVLARADNNLVELKRVLAGIDSYVGDTQLREDITQTFASARELSSQLSETVTSGVDKLVVRYVAVADDLSGAIDSIQQLIDSAGEPDGTLGKMIVDPQLYDNLNDAAERLNRALEEVQLLFQKWKAEGVELKL